MLLINIRAGWEVDWEAEDTGWETGGSACAQGGAGKCVLQGLKPGRCVRPCRHRQ